MVLGGPFSYRVFILKGALRGSRFWGYLKGKGKHSVFLKGVPTFLGIFKGTHHSFLEVVSCFFRACFWGRLTRGMSFGVARAISLLETSEKRGDCFRGNIWSGNPGISASNASPRAFCETFTMFPFEVQLAFHRKYRNGHLPTTYRRISNAELPEFLDRNALLFFVFAKTVSVVPKKLAYFFLGHPLGGSRGG